MSLADTDPATYRGARASRHGRADRDPRTGTLPHGASVCAARTTRDVAKRDETRQRVLPLPTQSPLLILSGLSIYYVYMYVNCEKVSS